MKSIAHFAVSGLALFTTVVSGVPTPSYFQKYDITRRDLSAQTVQKELGPQLTKSSLIFGPDNALWANATQRWNVLGKPNVEVVVRPAAEKDVPTIVKYCNKNGIDYIAVNRGHSYSINTRAFTGLQIDLGGLTAINVAADKKTAWAQGGVYGDIVISKLYEQGLVAATGSCTCVSLLGPGLGGGHGRFEGKYGMVSDNFLQFNLVLADGSTIVVNKTSHSDLWWGLRGAGHNFGIVTSAQINVFPKGPELWHYHNYIWKQDKLEPLFTELNKLHKDGNTPVELSFEEGFMTFNTSISTTEAVLRWSFAYAGSATDAEKLLAPFNKLGAVWEEQGDVPYPQIPAAQGTALIGPFCRSNLTRIMSTANLQTYNLTANRKAYNTLNSYVKKYPAFISSNLLYEGYSNKAVRTFDPKDSAYPQRDDNHLLLFSLQVAPNSTDETFKVGRQFATEIKDIWNAGQPNRYPTTYVNYANGLESVESLYGPEPWRIQRLKGLKSKYDPGNRFKYYQPIIRDANTATGP